MEIFGRFAPRLLLAVSWFVAVGCAPEGLPDVVPIRGVVTLDGQPLPSGEVRYMPTDSAGRQARGRIDSRGRFELSTLRPDDGALPGEYKIVVLAPAEESTEDAAARRVAENAGPRRRTFSEEDGPPSLAPLRYTRPESSGLTDVVDENHSGSIELKLTSDSE